MITRLKKKNGKKWFGDSLKLFQDNCGWEVKKVVWSPGYYISYYIIYIIWVSGYDSF